MATLWGSYMATFIWLIMSVLQLYSAISWQYSLVCFYLQSNDKFWCILFTITRLINRILNTDTVPLYFYGKFYLNYITILFFLQFKAISRPTTGTYIAMQVRETFKGRDDTTWHDGPTSIIFLIHSYDSGTFLETRQSNGQADAGVQLFIFAFSIISCSFLYCTVENALP